MHHLRCNSCTSYCLHCFRIHWDPVTPSINIFNLSRVDKVALWCQIELFDQDLHPISGI